MNTYFYLCDSCKKVREDDCSIHTFKEHHPKCLKCGKECDYTFIPTVPQVAFKDGPSGSWPSKGDRIKKQRQQASEAAGKRQRDRYGASVKRDAIPNYDSKDTGTWAEAQQMALKERGKASAATYNDKVKKEKGLV